MGLYFVAHTGQSEEDAVEVAANADVGIADGAEDAATFELVEGDACPAEEEEDKDDVAQTVYPCQYTVFSYRYCKRAYTSMFRATSWPLAELFRALNVSRRLTGNREEPGIVGLVGSTL